jgi:hypothetical protein
LSSLDVIYFIVVVALQKGRERLIVYIDDTRPTGILEKVVILTSEAN